MTDDGCNPSLPPSQSHSLQCRTRLLQLSIASTNRPTPTTNVMTGITAFVKQDDCTAVPTRSVGCRKIERCRGAHLQLHGWSPPSMLGYLFLLIATFSGLYFPAVLAVCPSPLPCHCIGNQVSKWLSEWVSVWMNEQVKGGSRGIFILNLAKKKSGKWSYGYETHLAYPPFHSQCHYLNNVFCPGLGYRQTSTRKYTCLKQIWSNCMQPYEIHYELFLQDKIIFRVFQIASGFIGSSFHSKSILMINKTNQLNK